jgi:hypothetical protein
MARAIGYVKSFENGTFYVRDVKGSVHQLKAGETINDGDHVYGAYSNGFDAKIVIDVLLDGAGDLVLAGDGALQFDSSLLANIFSHHDAVVHVNSLKEAMALSAAAEAEKQDASKEEGVVDEGTEAGDETAAGTEVTDTERMADAFDARTGAITDVTTDLRVTSPNLAEPTVDQTEIVLQEEDSTPTVDWILAAGEDGVVDEGALSGGNLGGDTSTSGILNITTGGDTINAVGGVVINGVDVTNGGTVNGTYGDLVVTVSGGVYSWTYILNENAPHTDPTQSGTNDQFPEETFTVVVTDDDGDSSAPANLLITINDDGPVASGYEGATYEEGSGDHIIAEDAADFLGISAGADGLQGTLQEIQFTNTGSSDGTLVINTAGQLVYSSPNQIDSSTPITETFSYTVTDQDGDSVTQTVSFGVSDIGVSEVSATSSVVDEDDITGAGGNTDGFGDDGQTLSGSISFTLGTDPVKSVSLSVGDTGLMTLGGEDVNTYWDADNNTLVGYAGADQSNVVFTIAVTNITNSGADYSVTLYQPVEHPLQDSTATEETETAFEDNLGFTVNVSVLDSDDSEGLTTFNVSIDDDTPVAYDPTDSLLLNMMGETITESLGSMTAIGADKYISGTNVIFSTAQEGMSSFTSNELPIYYYVSPDGKTLTGSTSNTEGEVSLANTIFKVEIFDAADEYKVTMYDTIDNGSGAEFSNLSGTGEAGNPSFKIVESTSSDNLEILFTPLGTATTVNSDSNDVAVGGQFIKDGDGLRINFGKFSNDNKGTGTSKDDTVIVDENTAINGFSFKIDQVSQGTTATLMLATYDAAGNMNDLSDDNQDPITRVIVYDAMGGLVSSWNAGEADTAYISDNGDGTVTVSALLVDYNVVTFTANGYDGIEIMNDANDMTDGKFSLSQLEVLVTQEGMPLYENFETILTDADGDTSTGTIEVTFAPGDAIIGTSGDDSLGGTIGNDQIFGGDGDDVITADDHDLVIDGGAGNDTLMFSEDTTIDFSALNSANNPITNIEIIDLNDGTHTLENITLQDVIDITGGGNTLTIIGDATDIVTVENTGGATWSKIAGVGDDFGFDIYTNTGDPTVVLKVQTAVDDSIIP